MCTRSRHRYRVGVAALAAALACSLVLPAMALASPADDVWAGVQVSLEKSPKGVPTMLVQGTLSRAVGLPAEVALAVPAGKRITWVGEVFPSGDGQDAKVDYRVEPNAAPGWDRVVFKLTKSRNAQVEVTLPGAITAQGTKELAKVTWVPLGGVPSVQMELDMPAGSKVVTGTRGGQVLQGDRGPVYAAVSSGAIRAGVVLSLSVLYTPGAGGTAARGVTQTAGGQAASAKAPGAPTPLLAVVVVLVIVLGYLIVSRRMAPSADDGTGGGDASDAAEEAPDQRGPDDPA